MLLRQAQNITHTSQELLIDGLLPFPISSFDILSSLYQAYAHVGCDAEMGRAKRDLSLPKAVCSQSSTYHTSSGGAAQAKAIQNSCAAWLILPNKPVPNAPSP